METVAIAGVGLIGGSFALALRKAGFKGRILGVSSERTLRQALDLGIVDEAATLAGAAARADLLYLSQPVLRILATLDELQPLVREDCLVTDAGSTKARIAARGAAALGPRRFLGGHPMAGKETRGCAAADADLFRGRTWVLTPLEPEQMELPAVAAFRWWIEAVGAVPLVLSPGDHDAIVAFTSHLPQLVSTALAAAIGERLGPERARLACGPGLLDATRLALSPYDVWADILATNETPVEAALDAMIGVLQSLRSGLTADTTGEVFSIAARFAAALRKAR
jgi:prephenate dehydrogenase